MRSELFWINLSDYESDEENASHWTEQSQEEIIPPEATDSEIHNGRIPVISDGAVNLGPEGFSTSPTAVTEPTETKSEKMTGT